MKNVLLILLLFPFLTLSQVQIGQDIDGEAAKDYSGYTMNLSSDGSIVAISAIGATHNDSDGDYSGHVRVFENQIGTWVQVGQDIDGEQAEDSSNQVSLSSDGTTVAIGAPGHDGLLGTYSGHVRVFKNQSGTWVQVGQDIDGGSEIEFFGRSVNLSSDGSIVAIGAPSYYINGGFIEHVRIYENQSGTWVQVGQDIDGEAGYDGFGRSISLSTDGTIVAIGAPENDGYEDGSGYVRIYENQSGTWVQVGQDIEGEAEDDGFGRSISLSTDGNIIAIGAPQNDENGVNSGHVRVFENQSGTWVQVGQDIEGEDANNKSGSSVSLSSDGSIVAIGAQYNDGNAWTTGHVRVYGNQSGTWVRIIPDIDGEAGGDRSGYSVSLSSDGSIVAIGAFKNNGNGVDSGHVRVYDLTNPLSIEEFSMSEFSIFPNPTKDQFTIQLNTSSILEKVTIYNTLGQVVLTSEEMILNTSKLASGSYVVEITTNKGKASKKLIIE